MGWFFGFKLHLVFNTDNEIVALKLTPVHDTTPVPALTRDLIGKLFGDKGYIGQKLAEDLLRRGLTLFTRVRRNMKSLPLSLQDKALLNARNMAETIIGHIKEFSSLNLSKHRSVINAFVHIIAAITALYVGFAGRSIISGLWQGSGQPVHRLGIEAWRRDCGPAPHTLLIRLDGILGRIAPDPAYKVDEQQTLPSIFL